MGTRYPAELVEWVKDNYLLMDTAELAAGCNERFGTNMNLKAMNSMKKRYGLKGGPRVKIYSDIFPKEVCEYILGNYKGIGPTEMAEKCSRIFGREYTAQQLKSFYKNKHINSGKTGRFEKGQKSWNKGKPMSQEQYAKQPCSKKAIGHITICRLAQGL